jgi:hypothetical protein
MCQLPTNNFHVAQLHPPWTLSTSSYLKFMHINNRLRAGNMLMHDCSGVEQKHEVKGYWLTLHAIFFSSNQWLQHTHGIRPQHTHNITSMSGLPLIVHYLLPNIHFLDLSDSAPVHICIAQHKGYRVYSPKLKDQHLAICSRNHMKHHTRWITCLTCLLLKQSRYLRNT